MRGEYPELGGEDREVAELPPRARRILFEGIPGGFNDGTTSACAENTVQALLAQQGPWNYLRVRGEYWSLLTLTCF